MPKKQTRQSIEAELNASVRVRILKKIEDLIDDWDELESDLCEREDQLGLPYQSKSILERMVAVAMPKEKIERGRTLLAVITRIARSNSIDDLPEDISRELAEKDAEVSALDQLQHLLDAAKRKGR